MIINIRADCPRAILIGVQGENRVTSVCIDFSKWKNLYGAGELYAYYIAPDHSTAERVDFTIDPEAAEALWEITMHFTETSGQGKMQLIYETAEPKTTIESDIFNVHVC